MYLIALKMLIEDKTKYIGMILSISFSTLIITQQVSIFFGLMKRTYSAVRDTPQADVWVMNPSVKMVDDINSLRDIDLLRIRSIQGVKWAMPLFRGQIKARLADGTFQNCNLIGIDSNTLIGGPHTVTSGTLEDLRQPFSVIIDNDGAQEKLGGIGLQETFELNDRRARVVGFCNISRTFRSEPTVYTTYDNALWYVPSKRKQLSFILASPDETVSAKQLCARIEEQTTMKAFTSEEFSKKTVYYYVKNTGIAINFGLAVLLGLLVGATISGQIFFNFTSDNLRYLALFNTVGAQRSLLAKITILQSLWVALIGWGIGSGSAALLGFITERTQLSFFLPWQLFVSVGILMVVICIGASLISIARIYTIELNTMFKQ